MDDRAPRYYLTMEFSAAQGGSNWTTEAGPFATADEAIDGTVAERDYGTDYKRCTLTHVDEAGKRVQIAHPRLEYKKQHDEWQASFVSAGTREKKQHSFLLRHEQDEKSSMKVTGSDLASNPTQ